MSPMRSLQIASICQAAFVVLAAAALAWQSPERLDGCLWGGGIMAFNFALMRLTARLGLQAGRLTPAVASLLLGKFVAVVGLTAAVMMLARPDVVGFAVGLCSLFAGVLGAAVTLRSPSPLAGAHGPRT